MKIATIIAATLLGAAFVLSGLVVILGVAPTPPPPPEGSPPAHFFAAFGPTGYLTFVKWLEVIGGILVAIPKTRRAGLLVLGSIIVNILAFHVFVTGGEGLFSPALVVIGLLATFLVYAERAAFASFCIRK